MDISRVLQAGNLSRSIAAAVAIAAALVAGAAAVTAGRAHGHKDAPVVIACEGPQAVVEVEGEQSGNAVIESCLDSPDAWLPPY